MPNIRKISKIQKANEKILNILENPYEKKIIKWRNRAIEQASKVYPAIGSIVDNPNYQRVTREDVQEIMAKEARKTMKVFDNFVIDQLDSSKQEDDWFDFYYEQYLGTQVLQKSKLITGTLMSEIQQIISRGVEGSKAPREIARDLQMEKGFSKARANTIARTETHNAANYAQEQRSIQRQRERGETLYKAWIPARDERTREAHFEMINHPAIPVDSSFTVGGEQMKMPGDPNASAANVINCFHPDTVVQGEIVGASKARYSGQMREIITIGGKALTVTPNHPILTTEGFVFAKNLHKLSNLVTYRPVIDLDVLRLVDNNIEQKPTIISEVFSTLNCLFGSNKCVVGSLDFNGDARFFNSDVDIVNMNGELVKGFDIVFYQDVKDGFFIQPAFKSSKIGRFCSENSFTDAYISTLRGNMRSLGLAGSFFGSHERPLNLFTLGLSSRFNSSRYEMSFQGVPADARFVGDLIKRDSRIISFDKIVEIKDIEFSGHVYDLTTVDGIIIANDIISSNCRCVTMRGSAEVMRNFGYDV